MSLDYATLTNLRKNHPAWRLLLADHAPLIATFLQQVFVSPNEGKLLEQIFGERDIITDSDQGKSFRAFWDFLDDQAYLENRRIMDVLHGIETRSLALRDGQPKGTFGEIDSSALDIQLPMERPLYSPPLKPVINDAILPGEAETLNTGILFDQVVIDKTRLAGEIRKVLQLRSQITLAELIEHCPLEQGLAELLAYPEPAKEY